MAQKHTTHHDARCYDSRGIAACDTAADASRTIRSRPSTSKTRREATSVTAVESRKDSKVILNYTIHSCKCLRSSVPGDDRTYTNHDICRLPHDIGCVSIFIASTENL